MKRYNRKKHTAFLAFILAAMLIFTGCAGNDVTSGATEKTGNETEEKVETGNAAAANEADDTQEVITEPVRAWDFTVKKTDGSEFTLSDQKGKVVLLNFWATWCGPCVYEMPIFEQLYEEYSEDEVMILAVNCMEEAETVDAFIKESGYTFPFAYDEDGAVGMQYGASSIPYTLVIDEEGMIQGTFIGVKSIEDQYKAYKNAIEYLLNN